jgi:hypothetical protein
LKSTPLARAKKNKNADFFQKSNRKNVPEKKRAGLSYARAPHVFAKVFLFFLDPRKQRYFQGVFYRL